MPAAQEIPEGDIRLWACDQRDPRTLAPGLIHEGRNLRFTDGVPETRRGVAKPAWGNKISAGTDVVRSHGTPYGLGTFQDPDGYEWLIKAQDGYAWRTRPYNQPVSIPLPTGVKILSRVKFVQAFDRLFAFRGRHLAPLVLSDIGDSFEDIVDHWAAATAYAAGTEVAYGPFQTITSISRTETVATVITVNPHGYITGADVEIRNATQTAYNGRVNITVVDDYTFTFTVYGSPATPATTSTTIQVSNMSRYYSALGSQVALTALSWGTGTSTATKATHGFTIGQTVAVTGAVPILYNGTYTVADANTFTRVMADPGAATTLGFARYGSVLLGQSPDTHAAAWNRIYDILPNGHTALYINNRLLVVTAYQPASVDSYATFSGGAYAKTDFIIATSYLDYIHFDFNDEFRINQGSDDEIIDLARVPGEDTVVVWKGHSWGILSNVRLDLTDLRWDNRSKVYGLSGPDAWAETGSSICFVSNRRGVINIRQSENGKLIGADVPLSAPIQKTIDRLDWTQSGSIRLVNWQNRLYCAMPLKQPSRTGDDLLTPGNNAGAGTADYVMGSEADLVLGSADDYILSER